MSISSGSQDDRALIEEEKDLLEPAVMDRITYDSTWRLGRTNGSTPMKCMTTSTIQKNENVYMPVKAEAARVRFRLDDGRTA